MNSDQRLIVAQGKHISEMKEEIRFLRERVEMLEGFEQPARAWMDLVAQITSNPTLQEEWDRFLVVLRMSASSGYLKDNP